MSLQKMNMEKNQKSTLSSESSGIKQQYLGMMPY